MSNLLDSAPGGYLAFSDEGLIAYVNNTLANWLGYTREDLTGKSIESIFNLATRIFYNTHFFPLVKLHTKAEEIFLSLRTKAGNDIPVLTNAERRLENGEYTIHCIFIPVVQRKKYEDEILKAKRDAENALKENKGVQSLTHSLESRTRELDRQYQKQLAIHQDLLQFSKIISHDLQEPLHKIQLFADVVSREPGNKLTEKTTSAIQKINAAAERLRILITGLHEYVSVDTEKAHSTVNLNEVIEHAKAKAIKGRRFDLFDLEYASLPSIQGYRMQLELLFFHLIDNAIQFRDPGKRLKIEITCINLEENIYKVSKDKYKFEKHVRLTFSDNGVGFNPEYKAYVFELLKKINPVSDGLGMGLSLIKKIVDNHAGNLAVNSETGKGTRFTIHLPLQLN
jgi:sigma-B regulation protein RsbU (phosphoserine phosphatase)